MSDKIKQRAQNIKRIRLERERAVFMKLGEKIRAYFFTGILVTAPVAITAYIAYKIFLWIDNSVHNLIPPEIIERYNIPMTVPGIGIILLVLFLIFVGMFAAGFIGADININWVRLTVSHPSTRFFTRHIHDFLPDY